MKEKNKKNFRCKECQGTFFMEHDPGVIPICPYCGGVDGFLIFEGEEDCDDWHEGVES